MADNNSNKSQITIFINAISPYQFMYYEGDFCNLLGYTIEEFQSSKFYLSDIVSKKEFDKINESIKTSLDISNRADFKFRAYKKDNSEIIIMSKGHTFTTADGVTVIQCAIIDITETVKTKRVVKPPTDFESFANSLPNGVSKHLLDNHLSLIWANKSFYNLSGYNEDEFEEKYEKNTFGMVYPQDLAVLIDALANLSEEQDSEAVIRIVNKAGEVKWVNAILANSGEKQGKFSVVNLILTDIDNLKAAELTAFLEKKKFEVLAEITEEFAFEYDIKDKVLTLAEKFEQAFDCPLVMQNISQTMTSYNILPPESYDTFSKILDFVASRQDFYTTDIQLNTKHGKEWFLSTFVCIKDEEGNSLKITGLLRNINEQKLEHNKLQRRAESDLMTGLLNKATTEGRIRDKLRLFNAASNDVLMLIDIDNFKNINDTYGHLVGDDVIVSISETFGRVIDTHHIVGRTGGDEFTVYLSDIKSTDEASVAAENIAKTLAEIASEKNLGFTPTLSIGIAPVSSSMTYPELVEAADTALYKTKLKGKNGYTVFTNEMQREQYINNRDENESPVIDLRKPDDATSSKNNLEFIEELVNVLYMRQNTYQTLEAAMKMIGTHYNIDRINIFEYAPVSIANVSKLSCTHRWNKRGNSNLSEEQLIVPPTAFDKIAELCINGSYYIEDFSDPAIEHITAFPTLTDIKGMVFSTVSYKNRNIGYITFSTLDEETIWSQEEVSQFNLIFKLLAEIISSSYKTSTLATFRDDFFTILNASETARFVININTYEVIYVNPAAKELFPELVTGGYTCYQKLYHGALSCEECPAKKLSENVRSGKSAILYEDKAYVLTATPIAIDVTTYAALISVVPMNN